MTIVGQAVTRLRHRFSSCLHDDRIAAWLGIALGISFTVCFLTGLVSHTLQHPPSWFTWPSRPAGLFRITQGVHVATGIASIPLLLAKLWVVYPKLFRWPPVAGVAHAVERISLVPLVGGALFQLFTGTANIAYWYRPMPFFFTVAHFWSAWITIGALIVHIGAKLTTTRAALARTAAAAPTGPPTRTDGLSRRGFLATVAGASGVLALATVGETLRPLNRLSVLAPRRLGIGPQGRPVNRSAAAAGIHDAALDPNYRLVVDGRVTHPLALSLDELRAMPQHEASLPIACVEGWSYSAHWRGVRVRDLLDRAGAAGHAHARVQSLEAYSIYGVSPLNRLQARDRDTLLALELDGEPLALDHGYPVRLIGPNRPGVDQTKWVHRVTVL